MPIDNHNVTKEYSYSSLQIGGNVSPQVKNLLRVAEKAINKEYGHVLSGASCPNLKPIRHNNDPAIGDLLHNPLNDMDVSSEDV